MKRTILRVLVALALAAGASAQEATVVVLAPDETATARAAYAKLQAAQKEFDAVKDALVRKYQSGERFASGEFWYFSADYKAMVPYWNYAMRPSSVPCADSRGEATSANPKVPK